MTENRPPEKTTLELRKIISWMDMLLTNLQEGVVVLGKNYEIRYCNNAFAALLGKEPILLLGVSLPELMPSLQNILPADDGKKTAKRLLTSLEDGKILEIAVSVLPVETQEIILVFQDVTEKKKEEGLLRKSQQRLAEAQQIANMGSWEWDMLTNTLTWSDELYRIYGLSPHETPITYETFTKHIHPEDREAVARVIENASRNHKHFAFDHRIIRTDGEVRALYARGEVVVDENHRPIRMMGTGQDITERKQVEEKILISGKMSAVGQMAAGVVHEINNPLGIILGFAQALQSRVKPDDALAMPVQHIVREANRCISFIQKLLVYSRSYREDLREDVDINAAVEESLSLVVARSRIVNVEIVRELSDNLPPMSANKNQIQQIIVNLGNNAMDAMPDGGRLIIKTGPTQIDGGPGLLLEIGDTGAGIAKENLSKIFEPFFTTKEAGKGTGLGLSLVNEIVQKHRGIMQVKSDVGKGTIFTLYFPLGSVK